MAVNSSRSMNADFGLGSNLDGKLKCLTPDRGGVVDESFAVERAHWLQPQYNITHHGQTFNTACGCGCN